MEAGAAVPDGAGRLPVADESGGSQRVRRSALRAAAQQGLADAGPAEDRLQGAHVLVLAGVRGAHHRQFRGRQGQVVRRTRLDERHEGKGLDGGPQEHRHVRRAGGPDDPAGRVHLHDVAAVATLHGPAALHLYEDRRRPARSHRASRAAWTPGRAGSGGVGRRRGRGGSRGVAGGGDGQGLGHEPMVSRAAAGDHRWTGWPVESGLAIQTASRRRPCPTTPTSSSPSTPRCSTSWRSCARRPPNPRSSASWSARSAGWSATRPSRTHAWTRSASGRRWRRPSATSWPSASAWCPSCARAWAWWTPSWSSSRPRRSGTWASSATSARCGRSSTTTSCPTTPRWTPA